MKARQNSDDNNRAYVHDAKMVPTEKGNSTWDYLRILAEIIIILLFLVCILFIVLTIMQG